MKYIVISVVKGELNLEIPFIFPDVLVHKDVAERMIHMLFRQFSGGKVCAISAGFLSSMDAGEKCHGESETLRLVSRGKIDDQLISMADYGSLHA